MNAILQMLITYRLDAIAFAFLLMAAIATFNRILYRHHGHGFPRIVWIFSLALVCLGAILPELTGRHERYRLRNMLEGIAPTYAQEFERSYHAGITLDVSQDDARYVNLLEKQKRWQKVNPNVADIYTLRKLPDGQLILVVDSETDYNHDGKYDGEREQRTRVGEIYTQVTPNMLRAFDDVASFDAIPETDRWGTWVSAYVPLHDATGAVEAVLGVDYDARTWHYSIAAARGGMLGITMVLAVILLASSTTVAITRAELEKRKIAEKEREEMQRQLLLTSRQAGMAEVATSVLHNVGNVLNSVNISTSVISEQLLNSKTASLVKATSLLRENRRDISTFLATDERGKLLPDYLIRLADLLTGEHDTVLSELGQLSRSVDHIKQIVAAQQTFARIGYERETFNLADVIEDAIRINTLSLERHGITLEKTIAQCDPITSDRHKLLQVVVNLISNANKAVESNSGPKLISISLRQIDAGGNSMLQLVVRDNGMGIPPENISRIFTHGFTTRKDGHGFGLHFSAIAIQQMKGTLTVDSDGPGLGATFTIQLPTEVHEVASCK